MKVNVVTPWNVLCGNANYAKGLVREQKKHTSLRVVEIDQPYTHNPLYFPRLAKKASQDCDVIHIHHGYGVFGKLGISGIFTPLFYLFLNRRKKIITSLHDVYDLSGMRGVLRRRISSLMFSRSDILHVHSQEAARILHQQGVSKSKIFFSPLAVFQDASKLKKVDCKEKLGLKGKKVVLLLGFIQKNKGHDKAIQFLSSLPSDVVLLIAGHTTHPTYLTHLQNMARARGVEDRIVFKSPFKETELPTLLGAADAALLPYRTITQSSIFSFLAANTIPTITSDLPFFKKIEEEYHCVQTAASEKDYIRYLSQVLSDSPTRKKLIIGLRNYVKDRRVEKIAEKIKKLYTSKTRYP